jgi:hypothetical protein
MKLQEYKSKNKINAILCQRCCFPYDVESYL